MKLFLIGEAFRHKEELLGQMESPDGIDVRRLPKEAAFSDKWDWQIGPDDVIVTLNFRREGKRIVCGLLHVPGAGLDGIDRSSLSPDCPVCNVFEHQIPIAEYVLLAMLEWEIRLSEMRRAFSPEKWSSAYRARVPHGELHGKTLGLVGFGRIGKAIAERAKAFGMGIRAVDRYAADPEGLAGSLSGMDGLTETLRESDFVVISCPLTEETEGMMDHQALSEMKSSAVLINVSRGPIVDEEALYEALSERRIGGAVLDVWYRYPKNDDDQVAPSDYPFHRLDNVFCTPHSCAWTEDLTRRRYGLIAKNIGNLLAGRPLLNRVK